MLLTELLQRGQLLRRQDRSAAINCFEQCIQESEASGNRRLLINALTELALLIIEIGQPNGLQRAKNLLLRAEVLLIGCPDCVQESAYLLYGRGILYFQLRNFVDSLVHLRSAYRAYEHDSPKLCHVDDALGTYYAALGDFQAALFHFERSLAHRQTFTDNQDLGISYVHLGQLHLQMHQQEQAEHYFQQSLELANQWEDCYLQIKALAGLGQVAIEREQWQSGNSFIHQALQISQQSSDLVNVTYLQLNWAETLLGQRLYVEAQNHINTEVVTQFQNLEDLTGLAKAKRTLGKILSQKLRDGIDTLNEEVVEIAEDYFFEAAMLFEELNMPQEYAKTLYNMALMYKVCINPKQKYQYQGRALRSLELALGILEKVNYGAANLIFQIEVLLNQIDRSVWLERTMTRLRGRQLLSDSKNIKGQREEVTLLFVELYDHKVLAQQSNPDDVMQLLHIYLRYMTEVIQKYKGTISYMTGTGMMVIFQPSHTSWELATNAKTEMQLVSKEPLNLHHALRATLTAQEMLMRMQTVNEELFDRGLPAQQIRIALDTGTVLVGNVETYTKVEFVAIGSTANLALSLCQATAPGQVRLSQTTYNCLRRILSSQAIAVTKIPDQLHGWSDTFTYALNELSYYTEPTKKPAWLLNAEFPAIVRIGLTVQPDLEEVAVKTVAAVIAKLGLSSIQRYILVEALHEIYREVLLQSTEPLEILLLFLPEETKLEILMSLESLEHDELQNLKEALTRMRNRRGSNSLTRVSESYIDSTLNSLTVRLVQLY